MVTPRGFLNIFNRILHDSPCNIPISAINTQDTYYSVCKRLKEHAPLLIANYWIGCSAEVTCRTTLLEDEWSACIFVVPQASYDNGGALKLMMHTRVDRYFIFRLVLVTKNELFASFCNMGNNTSYYEHFSVKFLRNEVIKNFDSWEKEANYLNIYRQQNRW